MGNLRRPVIQCIVIGHNEAENLDLIRFTANTHCLEQSESTGDSLITVSQVNQYVVSARSKV